ncbi:hypothetical protein SH528x_000220 [Novipirellula sp. SH528]|uniref:hypothetical protein n=1 Tax=Novipirellula sp. SH528 TaxID=3454466 RepID=UPI003FA0BE92
MKVKTLLCLLLVSLLVGCSDSEPSSVADGLSQKQIDDYNALVEKEAKLAAEAGDIGFTE